MPRLTPRDTLETLLGHLGFVFEVEELQQGDKITLNIKTRDPARLIGRDGQVVDDLQYLVNRLVSSDEETAPRVSVDIDGYRKREQQDFVDRIQGIADKVRKTGQPGKLPPMNSYDRRIVHQLFQDDPAIKSQSEESADRLKAMILMPRHSS
jgi:spoIIIJ-associated protein